MTLCMAAVCQEKGEHRIVTWTDTRIETGWAGADIAYKYDRVGPNWQVLIAGEPSKGRELAATCRRVLKPDSLTADNIYDSLNEVTSVHKEKLTERFVRKKLGISFTRFLTKGEKELPADVRNRIWYAIEKLEFGAEIIICGFIDGLPHVYSTDEDGNVYRKENFVAIGSGCVTAQSMLYFREQHGARSLEQTLYHLYEAFQVTYFSKAPGVGGVSEVAVFSPQPDGRLSTRLGLSSLMVHLDLSYQKYGPKIVGDIPPLPDKCLIDPVAGIKVVLEQMRKGE